MEVFSYNLRSADALHLYAWQLADVVVRLLPPECNPEIQTGVSLASALVAHYTVANKHVCLNLEQEYLATTLLPGLVTDQKVTPNQYAELAAALVQALQAPAAKAVVSPDKGDLQKPLVLEDNRLYLQRYWEYEQQCANLLIAFKNRLINLPELPLDQLVNATTDLTLDPRQIKAVKSALQNNLTIITGGPGTGKTTIVAVVIALLLQLDPEMRICLCAPTGKAQARLKEALDQEIADNLEFGDDQERKATMQQLTASTMHRLLRYNFHSDTYTFSASNKLQADLVVVDEVSMVDLPLLVKLLSALPDNCRLLLLGDKDQLAAVETGAALAAICHAWQTDPMVTTLSKSYRFATDGGISQLKNAVNQGDVELSWQHITQGNYADLSHETTPKTFDESYEQIKQFLQQYQPYRCFKEKIQAPLEDGSDLMKKAASILAEFNDFRILCAMRQGPCGVEFINKVIREELGIPLYGNGYPLMITRNNYELNLYNGDIGICMLEPDTDNCLVFFPDPNSDTQMRKFSPAQLPEHETVFAMTVHKAQGSGFKRLLVILPEQGRILTRELLYTAITRAQQHCTLWCSREALQQCVVTPTLRTSGLHQKLTHP